MFPSTPPQLVAALEARLGSRRAVCHLLALASAAVLVAFPYDHRATFLKGLDQRVPQIRRLRRDVAEDSGPAADLRLSTLVFLLEGLEALHRGDREAILRSLEATSAAALSEAPSEFFVYREQLHSAHEGILRERLAARVDLN